MTKRDHLRSAATKISDAIDALTAAKQDLLHAKSDQHVPVAILIAKLEEAFEILTDPECTPEIYAVGGSE